MPSPNTRSPAPPPDLPPGPPGVGVSAAGRRVGRGAVPLGCLAGVRVAVVAGLDGVRSGVTDGATYLDDGAAVRVQP